MNLRALTTLIAVVSLISCTSPKYPGFKKLAGETWYKLEKIGEDEHKAKTGDYITLDIQYRTANDSLFFSGRRKVKLTVATYKGSIEQCFASLSVKDAATFVLQADDFFAKTLKTNLPAFIKPGSIVKVYAEMLEIQTEEQFDQEKQAFLKWTDDFGQYEKEILKQFMEQKKLNIKPTASGLFFIKLKNGNGKQVEMGDTVEVDYEGKFLDGKFFDSTIKRKEAFQFVYGQQWQVIQGLEEAIGLMREGDKALCLMPSQLAFGQSGSSTGIIPPFTSVIFEVELKSVRKAATTVELN
jgi:FKBP-type peptidyl-prolyl cis-trans isomerase FkpA